MMREGTYRDRSGNIVTVSSTASGYLVRYRDGRTISVALVKQ